MINIIQTDNPINATSASPEVQKDIQEALDLLDAVKAKDSQKSVKELQELLIEYILANMRGGDTADMQSIQSQMSQVIDSYGKDVQHANELKSKLKAMSSDPSSKASSDLAYLQNLITALRADVTSGDMSNLAPYFATS